MLQCVLLALPYYSFDGVSYHIPRLTTCHILIKVLDQGFPDVIHQYWVTKCYLTLHWHVCGSLPLQVHDQNGLWTILMKKEWYQKEAC